MGMHIVPSYLQDFIGQEIIWKCQSSPAFNNDPHTSFLLLCYPLVEIQTTCTYSYISSVYSHQSYFHWFDDESILSQESDHLRDSQCLRYQIILTQSYFHTDLMTCPYCHKEMGHWHLTDLKCMKYWMTLGHISSIHLQFSVWELIP